MTELPGSILAFSYDRPEQAGSVLSSQIEFQTPSTQHVEIYAEFMAIGPNTVNGNIWSVRVTFLDLSQSPSMPFVPPQVVGFVVVPAVIAGAALTVTTVGAEIWSDCMLFIPAVMRGSEAFSTYLMSSGSDLFLTRLNGPSFSKRALDDKTPVFKVNMGMEVRAMYCATAAFLKAECTVDAGTNEQTDIPNMGWGMLVMNSDGGFTYDPDVNDETLGFILTAIEEDGTPIYASGLTVHCDTKCYKSIRVGATDYPLLKALAFVGDLGEEVLLFRAQETEKGIAEKTFYKNQKRVRKVLEAYDKIRLFLRTSFESEEYRRLIHELLYAKLPVSMYGFYEQFYPDGYQEVTVITDEVDIIDRDQLIEPEIEVEYNE